MKMKWIISTTILGCLTLAGCTPADTSGGDIHLPTKITETRNDVVFAVTDRTYSNGSRPQLTSETRTQDHRMVYNDYSIEYDNKKYTATRYRINYDAYENEISREKRVSYYMTDWQTEYKQEVFALDAEDDAVPLEFWEEKYNSERLPISFIRKIDGVTVEERTDYEYSGDGESRTRIQTYTSKKGDVESIVRKMEISDDGVYTYINWNPATASGTLVEKRFGYVISTNIYELTNYSITSYDENGENPVTTKFQISYTTRTITE